MSTNSIPTGYNRVIPCLSLLDAEEFLRFTKDAFDAKELRCVKTPKGILHGELKVGDSVIMFTDAGKNRAASTVLMIYMENVDEAYPKALDAGAKSCSKPSNEFSGDRVAKVLDLNGIQWTIAARLEDLSKEEFEKRFLERAKERLLEFAP